MTEPKLIVDHDSTNKNLLIRWGTGYHISEDHGDYVLDMDEKGKVIGVELLKFEPEIKEEEDEYTDD